MINSFRDGGVSRLSFRDLPRGKTDENVDIAIIGVSGRYPGAEIFGNFGGICGTAKIVLPKSPKNAGIIVCIMMKTKTNPGKPTVNGADSWKESTNSTRYSSISPPGKRRSWTRRNGYSWNVSMRPWKMRDIPGKPLVSIRDWDWKGMSGFM